MSLVVLLMIMGPTVTSGFVVTAGGPPVVFGSLSSSSSLSLLSSSRLAASPQRNNNNNYDYDRMYSPRNDVYFYRPEDYMLTSPNGMPRPPVPQQRRQAISMQDPEYRSSFPAGQGSMKLTLSNPRNDVFARQPVIDSAELMVEQELLKIGSKGRYAIENELYNVHGIAVVRDVHTREELACLLLKARLSGGGQVLDTTNNHNGRNMIRNNPTNKNNNNTNNDNNMMNQLPPPLPQPPSYYAVANNNSQN